MTPSRKRTLALFVHGLGTSTEEFWGATATALQTHPSLLDAGVTVDFWGFKTTLKPEGRLKRVRQIFSSQPRLETLQQLGDHLWFVLGERHARFESIRLVGHSMGGLVVAAALGHLADGTVSVVGAKIQGIAFCCTPLSGAGLTDRGSLLFKLFGSNVHLDDLRPDSRSRKTIINTFINAYLALPGANFAVFRASGDEVVEERELLEEVPVSYRPPVQVLDGSHSGCIKDLQVKSENVARMVRWLIADAAAEPSKPGGGRIMSAEFRQDLIWFLLRGARDTYLRTLRDIVGSVADVRLNVMLFDAVAGTLSIAYCDYNEQFSEAEKRNRWNPHQGACGVAWATRDVYLYAGDLNEPAHRLQPMVGQAGSVSELHSVLSIPVWRDNECLGVLNVDSQEGVAATKLDKDYSTRIFRDAAKCVGWALASSL